MQAARDDGSLTSLLMERIQPGAALELSNRARFDGYLDAAVSHIGVETLQISLEGKESPRPNVHDASALKEER